ncbi:MAG: acyltransferase [Lachnospiraceae bacterium]|nr:acyltransferase [Lachnospiraceae bacterium]
MDTEKRKDRRPRLGYFDIAKGIGIILVIIAHIEYVDFGIRNYIVSFHMPLFFVVSGMLSCHINETARDIKTVLLKKLKRIMLPYLVFSVLYPLIDLAYFYVTGNGDPFGSLRQNISDTLVLYGNSVLWFLPTAFFGDMLFFLVMKAALSFSKKYAAYITAAVTLFVSLIIYFTLGNRGEHFFIALVRFFPAAFFAATGYLMYLFIEKINIKRLFLAAAGAVLLLLLILIHNFNGTVDMHFGVYGNIGLYYINAIMGSLGVILISMAVDRKKGDNRTVPVSPLSFLEFFGRNSLFIMITHINFYILYCAEVLSFKITEYIPRAKNIIFNFSTVFFVLAAEFVLIKIYEICKMIIQSKISDGKDQ